MKLIKKCVLVVKKTFAGKVLATIIGVHLVAVGGYVLAKQKVETADNYLKREDVRQFVKAETDIVNEIAILKLRHSRGKLSRKQYAAGQERIKQYAKAGSNNALLYVYAMKNIPFDQVVSITAQAKEHCTFSNCPNVELTARKLEFLKLRYLEEKTPEIAFNKTKALDSIVTQQWKEVYAKNEILTALDEYEQYGNLVHWLSYDNVARRSDDITHSLDFTYPNGTFSRSRKDTQPFLSYVELRDREQDMLEKENNKRFMKSKQFKKWVAEQTEG